MAGDTGQGMTATVFGQVIPNIRSIQTNNDGDEISETVADGILRQVISTGWGFTIDFVAPVSGTHTLEAAIKAGVSGSITIESGATRYTSANARSGGFSKSSPANGYITYSLNIVIDNDPTMAAVS